MNCLSDLYSPGLDQVTESLLELLGFDKEQGRDGGRHTLITKGKTDVLPTSS